MKTFRFFTRPISPSRYAGATLLGLLCSIGLWLLAPKTAFAQNPVQRDPQALTILAQTIKAGGGQELLLSFWISLKREPSLTTGPIPLAETSP